MKITEITEQNDMADSISKVHGDIHAARQGDEVFSQVASSCYLKHYLSKTQQPSSQETEKNKTEHSV